GDSETLAYRIARPSTVVARLTGPGAATTTLVNAAQSPGLHTFTWDGIDTGNLGQEGAWAFTVTATDDRNITTTAHRTFSLDNTLSSLAVKTGGRGLPTATFQLSRPATVAVRIQRPNGLTVSTMRLGSRAAGPQHATWSGRLGSGPAPRGRYRMNVAATSSV